MYNHSAFPPGADGQSDELTCEVTAQPQEKGIKPTSDADWSMIFSMESMTVLVTIAFFKNYSLTTGRNPV